MTWRAAGICGLAVGAVVSAGWMAWRVFTPGEVTSNEFHVILLLSIPALVFVLSSAWIGDGRPPADTRRDAYTRSDFERRIRPPWS